jgi:leucyl aminopeptidase
MTLQFKKIAKHEAKHRIIVFQTLKELEKFGFAKNELTYIKTQLDAKRKSITINHFGYFSFLLQPEEKKSRPLSLEACRVAGNALLSSINTHKIEEIQLIDAGKYSIETRCVAEGLALGSYQFLKYKGEKDKLQNTLKKLAICSDGIAKREVELLELVCESVWISRDLVNEPVSYMNTQQFAKDVQKLGKSAGFKVDVFNKAKIESLKMGGLLAVNQGSVDPPAFIVMEHKPKNAANKQPYIFVGKGVVYDTGGISLKPNDGMMTMKCDMAGAAAVAGALYSISKAGLPLWVIGITPVTDNRPHGNSVVPGDVITISDGTTVEVLNTDAEGRLILSDALVYAKKYKPRYVIDLATLTGAAVRAIGSSGIVAMTNTRDEHEVLKQCGDSVHERLVDFPLWDEYADMLKSDVADMKNIGGVIAGANTAGKFLEHFTDYPWTHLDIAGPAFNDGNDSYRGKGGTGYGVRLLFEFARTKAEL